MDTVLCHYIIMMVHERPTKLIQVGTEASDGYDVGTSGGRRTTKQIAFDDNQNLYLG
jgi:hypothetical protein